MSWLSNLVVKITGDNKDLKSKLKDSESDVRSFGDKFKAFASAASAGIGVLVAGLTVMAGWWKTQVQGIDAMNVAMAVTKQLITDIMRGQGLNLKEAAAIAKEQNRIRADDRQDLVNEALLLRDIRRYRLESVDVEKTLAERLTAANKALEKTLELESYRKKDLYENLKVTERALQINKDDEKLLQKRAELIAAIANVDESESLRLINYRNTLLGEQKNRVKDLIDAYTELENVTALRGIKPIAGPANISPTARPFDKEAVGMAADLVFMNIGRTGGHNLRGAPKTILSQEDKEAMASMNDELNAEMSEMEYILTSGRDMAVDLGSQIIEGLGEAMAGGNVKDIGKGLLLSLANFLSQFGKLLITMVLGMEAFIKSLATMNTVIAVAAGAAMLLAAGAIRGLVSGGGRQVASGGGGGGYSGGLQAQNLRVEVYGKISGKDLVIASKRYTNDN